MSAADDPDLGDQDFGGPPGHARQAIQERQILSERDEEFVDPPLSVAIASSR